MLVHSLQQQKHMLVSSPEQQSTTVGTQLAKMLHHQGLHTQVMASICSKYLATSISRVKYTHTRLNVKRGFWAITVYMTINAARSHARAPARPHAHTPRAAISGAHDDFRIKYINIEPAIDDI